jgi:putative peptidoglycan lipid II flippase
VLFSCHRSRVAAIALVSGWLLVIVTDVLAVPAVPPRWVVPVLALGNTVGLTLAGLGLLAAVGVIRGPAALRGSARAAGAGLAGALAGAAAGALVSAGLPVTGFIPNAGAAVLACLAATAAFGAVVLVLDGRDLRALAVRARARLTRRAV